MIILVYILGLVGLLLYSFSQIDLNLTLFQNPLFLQFQQSAIQLGYFNRPMSTEIFVFLLCVLSFGSAFLYKRSLENQISKKQVVFIFGAILVFGVLSYPAFSHDIFNYIFDVRLLVSHQVNPYASTALMFPTDDWTRFMNWTHRTYPYGPGWLVLTIPIYLLGLGKFTVTLFCFKFLGVAAVVGSSYLLGKLSGRPAAIFFATNPLILLEAVNSSHLDIVMLFFALLGYYMLRQNRKAWAVISLLISVAVKYSTGLFLPIFLWSRSKEKTQIISLVILALIGSVAQSLGREVLPHYFIVPLGFVALTTNKKIIWIAFGFSVLILLIRYVPYLSSGIWSPIKLWP